MVQTGLNNQFGGEKMGLFKVTYQVGIAETVNKDPIIPTPKQRPMDNISRGTLTDITSSIPEIKIPELAEKSYLNLLA